MELTNPRLKKDFAKEFLKRILLIKAKQFYRKAPTNLEAEKFEQTLKKLEEITKVKKETGIMQPQRVIRQQPLPVEIPKPASRPVQAKLVQEIAPVKPIQTYAQAPVQPLPAPAQQIQPQLIKPIPAPTTPTKPAEIPAVTSLDRLRPFLRDPMIQSIECPGPDKFITINRFGTIQTTNIRLSKEEINTMLKDLSQKTRIPLITGIFKVAYENIILTAVVSEFVGTRFIIQRKEFV